MASNRLKPNAVTHILAIAPYGGANGEANGEANA
jgi:hypothetical protein